MPVEKISSTVSVRKNSVEEQFDEAAGERKIPSRLVLQFVKAVPAQGEEDDPDDDAAIENRDEPPPRLGEQRRHRVAEQLPAQALKEQGRGGHDVSSNSFSRDAERSRGQPRLRLRSASRLNNEIISRPALPAQRDFACRRFRFLGQLEEHLFERPVEVGTAGAVRRACRSRSAGPGR